MSELTINTDGRDVLVHVGAWPINKGYAHHLYAPPVRWSGTRRGLNGNDASVKLRISFSIEYRTNNIDYIVMFSGSLSHDSDDKVQKFTNWSGSPDIGRVDGGEPTSAGRRVGCSLSTQVVETIKEKHMDDVRDAAVADCLTECDEMKQKMMDQVDLWEELKRKLESHGLEGGE